MKKWKVTVALALAALTLLALAVPALAASLIGTDRAKAIALEYAGVSSSEVRGMRTRLGREDGRRIYDVEFRANGVEYEFEIDAETGAIREYDRDGARQTGSTGGGTSGSTSGGTSGSSSGGTISLSEAKNIALNHAGVKASAATFVRGHLDYDDGRRVYEIEFYSGNLEYDYEIDAATGRIRDYDRDAEYYRPRSGSGSSGGSGSGGSGSSSSGSSGTISLSEAKNIALNHAGVKASAATFVRGHLDYDDGRRVYEIEFYSGNLEYDYEIDASTGRIRDYDRDAEYYRPRGNSGSSGSSGSGSGGSSSGSSSGGTISLSEAKNIALNHAGVSASSVRFTKARLDRDDGRQVYDIEFRNGRMEYDYEIDASTGRIRDYDRDYDD